MDIVGDTASILQLIEAGTTVSRLLYEYSKGIRNAPTSRNRLRDQIKFITTAALAAEEALKNNTTATTTTLQELSAFWLDPKSPAVKCRKILEDLHASLIQSGSTQMGIFQRLSWPVSEEVRIKAAIKDLDLHIPYLQLTLTTFNNHASSRIESAVHKGNHEQEHIRDVVTATKSEVGKVGTTLENLHNSGELKKMYKWLDAIDCTVKHETTRSLRKETTCEWLFQEERYSTWFSLKSAFLWIHGKPGAGKSVLASAVIEEILKTMSDKDTLLKVYCDFRTERSTSASEVVRSLLTQALRQSRRDWRQEFKDLVDRRSNGIGPPVDLKMLTELLIRALHLHERPIVVVDALDECKDYAKLVRILAELRDKASCRLFVTSRPLQHISTAFQGLLSVALEDMASVVEKDMKLHIETEIDLYPKLVSFRDEITESLLAKAEGMFRWLQCQLDRLSMCLAKGDIRHVLNTLPSGLYETYDRILQDVEKREFAGQRVRNLLLWLVVEQVELGRLVDLVMIDPEEDSSNCAGGFLCYEDLIAACGSLVRVESSELWDVEYVSLSHFSVKEYLSDGHLAATPLAHYHISLLHLHTQLVLRCISHLLSHELPDSLSVSRFSSPLHVKLALWSFVSHLCKVTPTELDDVMVQSLLALQKQVQSNPAKYLHIKAMELGCMESYNAPDAGIHVLVRYGPSDPWLLAKYLKQNHEFNLADVKDGESPLTQAVYDGKIEVASTLLDFKLDVNKLGMCIEWMWATEREQSIQGPIHPLASAMMGCDATRSVALLLSRGCSIPEDMIHTAIDISAAKAEISIFTLLMEHGANVTTLRAGGNNPLHTLLSVQVSLHRYDVVKLATTLVDAGCHPTAENDTGDTPLQLAINAGPGCWSVVEYLLSKGATFTDIHFHPDNLAHTAKYTWYALAADAARVANARRSTTLADVSRVRLLFQKRLKMPPSVVSCILDLAQYWACATILNDERPENRQIKKCMFLKPSPECRKVNVQHIQFSARTTGHYYATLDIEIQPRVEPSETTVSSVLYFIESRAIFTAIKGWRRRDPKYRQTLERLQPGNTIQIKPHNLRFLRIDIFYSVPFTDESCDV